ncbi:MAG TPA: hypothetical protein VE964_04475 [Myxococcales bacterium]|nr:hypothetical protein [Myxococcales bacterium]
MHSLPIRVGLVDTTNTVDAETMSAVAAALNVQVTRDLPQAWHVNATVSYLPNKEKIPQGVWPVQLVKILPPHEGGFHLTKHHQPYAKVLATPGSNEWTIDASHEILEMLVDSAGNRLQASEAIRILGGDVVDAPGKFEYLVEVCDPCEADEFGYQIDGYAMSDFITPHYYDYVAVAGTRYSFTGAIKRPRQLLKGGYISFVNLELDEVQQILWVDPAHPPVLRNLGPASGDSLRAFVESKTHHEVNERRAQSRGTAPTVFGRLREYRGVLSEAAKTRAAYYR